MSITITASASGSLTPTPVGPPFPDPKGVTNGDFLINHSVDKNGNLVGITGDGKTEQTNWTFKFASDPNFPRFSTSRPLTSVLLTLTLTPKDYLIRTDAIYIYRANTVPGLGGLGGSIPGSAIGGAPEIQNLPFDSNKPNRYYTIQMELLNRVLAPGYSVPAFSSDAILEVFKEGAGQIAMHYANDAIVSSAQLELTQEGPALQYAVKFVCGKSDGEVVAPGVYFTAINVHNPTYTTIRFRAKIAVALPGLRPGPVSKFFDAELGPDEALEIDCPDIFKYAETDANFLKGFVVIETDVELDVVSVYTAAGRDGEVATLHTERVPARRQGAPCKPDTIPVPGSVACVDFEPPLTLGTQYGTPVGQNSGDVAFTTANGITVRVLDFHFTGGGGAYNLARIEAAPVPFGSGQCIRTNNINLEFDFSLIGFATSQVQFEFLDLGGSENISVNGSSIFTGELAAVPSPIGGVSISVTTVPVTGGKKGTVTLTGVVKTLKIGGQEFWIDNVCARQ